MQFIVKIGAIQLICLKIFFGKTFEELQTIDGGKNRRIAEGFEKSIKELINSSEGWNVGD